MKTLDKSFKDLAKFGIILLISGFLLGKLVDYYLPSNQFYEYQNTDGTYIIYQKEFKNNLDSLGVRE